MSQSAGYSSSACFRGSTLNRWFCSPAAQPEHPKEAPRAYFYYIDSRGLVFFQEEEYRSFATCLKDKKFLVVLAHPAISVQTAEEKRHKTPPRLSLQDPADSEDYAICWGEYNYVKAHTLPVVFNSLYKNEAGEHELEYSWIFKQSFRPEDLAVDVEGRSGVTRTTLSQSHWGQ